jgi:hypothetical protein
VINARRMKWARHIKQIGKMRNKYKILVGRPEGKRPVGKRRHSQKDIKMELGKSGFECVY